MKGKRYGRIDALRGVLLAGMVTYHGMWDLVYLAGWEVPWFSALPGRIWQQSIAWGFILLSGFCASLGRGGPARSLALLGWSAFISAVTAFFFEEEAIYFGILSLMGSCGLIAWAARPVLRCMPPVTAGAVSFLLFFLSWGIPLRYIGTGPWEIPVPSEWYQYMAGAYLGFAPGDFHSLDYFPLLPWMFLFFAGYMAGRQAERAGVLPHLAGHAGAAGCLGRHSLPVYLLHQPVLTGLFQLGGMLS